MTAFCCRAEGLIQVEMVKSWPAFHSKVGVLGINTGELPSKRRPFPMSELSAVVATVSELLVLAVASVGAVPRPAK